MDPSRFPHTPRRHLAVLVVQEVVAEGIFLKSNSGLDRDRNLQDKEASVEVQTARKPVAIDRALKRRPVLFNAKSDEAILSRHLLFLSLYCQPFVSLTFE